MIKKNVSRDKFIQKVLIHETYFGSTVTQQTAERLTSLTRIKKVTVQYLEEGREGDRAKDRRDAV